MENAVEEARAHVAELIGASPKEIIFTSGATESNNMALKGIAHFNKGRKKHLITTQTEHKSVLDSCRVLESEGFDVTYLPVKQNGLIDMNQLEEASRPTVVTVRLKRTTRNRSQPPARKSRTITRGRRCTVTCLF